MAAGYAAASLISLFIPAALAALGMETTTLPPFAPLASGWVCAATLAHLKSQEREREMSALSKALLHRMEAEWIPENLDLSSHEWRTTFSFVSGLLGLKRSVILERVGEDHRVREISSLDGDLDVIWEKRRDYTRLPYTKAISENVPIRLERQYLVVKEGERQYLTTLIHDGKIAGFWAMSAGQDQISADDEPRFLSAVESYARELALLLVHLNRRKEAAEPAADGERDNPSGDTLDTMRSLMPLLNRKMLALEATLETVRTPAMVYDIMGRMAGMNKPMTAACNRLGLPAERMSLTEIVQRLTGFGPEQTRETVRGIILKGRTLTAPVAHEWKGGLEVKAINGSDGARAQAMGAGLCSMAILVTLDEEGGGGRRA